MNGRERVLAMLAGRPIDHLPAMPITMMFASDHSQVNYLQYATNYRVQVEAQLRVAEAYDFDYVSVISDPACEAADCGATVRFYPDQPPAIEEAHALLAEKSGLARLAVPDPLGGGRMHNRVKALARFKERVRGEKAVEGWIEGPAADAQTCVASTPLCLISTTIPPSSATSLLLLSKWKSPSLLLRLRREQT